MNHYNYDFVNALGDTIMEKYEALYLLLVECNAQNTIRMVIGNPLIMSIFETTRGGFEPSPIIAKVGDMSYVGQLAYSVSKMRFQCFKTERAAPNELILLCDGENAVIRFDGFL